MAGCEPRALGDAAARGPIAAWLGRVARAAATDRARLVLRGSLVTAAYCPGRLAADVDHVVPGPCGLDEARALVARVLAVEGAPAIEGAAVEVIWGETAWPGLRVRGAIGGAPLQVDVGWGDPLAVAPVPIALPAGAPHLLAVRPETLFGWKVHGLFERGRGFRPKDLYDLWLLERHAPLDEAALVASVRVAFASRGDALSIADRFVTGAWGGSRSSRRRWDRVDRKRTVSADPLPPYLEVRERVRARVIPLLAAATATADVTDRDRT